MILQYYSEFSLELVEEACEEKKMPVVELICLGVDAVVLAIVYAFYRSNSRHVESVKNAPVLDITKNLKTTVQAVYDGYVPYAVIRGSVKAIARPLNSKNTPDLAGVIQQNILTEHKLQWSWATRWWQEVRKNISISTNTVPFALKGDKALVEVGEPLQACLLDIPTVHDEFQPSQLGFWDWMTRFFIGETTTGYQHIEKMLTEGSTLTGVGALTLNGGVLRLEPPQHKLTYYLTEMSGPSLIKHLESDVKSLKVAMVIFGMFGSVMLAIVLVNYYHKYRERRDRLAAIQRMREAMEEQMREQQQQNGGVNQGDNGQDKTCVVCLNNPREVLILECGHICCCVECGYSLNPALCPVCRGPIARFVPAYIS